ncbi:MAG: glucan biosynthesis protein, partial [Salinisphaera sp.]|nr:glucan biosynthesis protein [Salinisphaera sp.]
FGLLQRERDFDNYQSLHAHYQDRPSLWIMPTGDWGKGQIELVEIPTADEYHDNMVAFWVPEQSPQSGEPLRYCYRMLWNANGPGSPLARVVATRTAERKTAKVVIAEFAAGEPSLTHQQLQTDIQVHGGKLLHTRLRRDPAYGVWRLTLRILPTRGERLRIRARLLHDGNPLSETWTYAIQPPIKRNP